MPTVEAHCAARPETEEGTIMAQAEIFDSKRGVSDGFVSALISSVFGRRAALRKDAQVAAQRRPDPREANYLSDIGMEVGL
jgi:hypothetical protein